MSALAVVVDEAPPPDDVDAPPAEPDQDWFTPSIDSLEEPEAEAEGGDPDDPPAVIAGPDDGGAEPDQAPLEVYDGGAHLEVVDPGDDEPTPAAAGAYPAEGLAFSIEPVGLGYRGRCGVLTLDLSHLKETRGELGAELTVSIGGHHVSRARFNLCSLSGRTSHARYLSGVPTVTSVPWRDLLERLCLEALNLHRAGASITELDVTEPDPRVELLLSPVLPLGVPTILFGPGGAGKSTLAAAIAVSLETGAEVIPGWRPLTAPVLVMDWEDSELVWRKRIRAIAAGAGVAAPRIRYQAQVRPLAERVEPQAAYIADHGIGMVILDSVGLASGGGREGGSAEESTLRLFQAARQLDTTPLMIDHVRGDTLESDGAISRPYGSVYKVNLARSVYELRRERHSAPGRAELLMVHTKVNDGPKQSPQGLAIVYEDGGRVIRFERAEPEAPELIGALTSKDRMIRLLRDGAATTAAIAAELDIKPRSVDAMVSRYRTLFARLPDRRVGLLAAV